MATAVDRAIQAIAAGVGACASPAEAVAFLAETRGRLVPRLEVMRRHEREPGMATYVERVVACIDDALEAGEAAMSTDPNDPIRRVVEEEEMVALRGGDADHIEEAGLIVGSDDDGSPGEADDQGEEGLTRCT